MDWGTWPLTTPNHGVCVWEGAVRVAMMVVVGDGRGWHTGKGDGKGNGEG